jgi:hypothetical protein
MRTSLVHSLAFLVAPAPLVAQPSIPEARPFAHRETIRMGYHAPSAHGFVELREMLLREGPEIRFSAIYNYPGQTPTTPPEAVTVALLAVEAPGAFGAARTRDAKRLAFLLDSGVVVRTDTAIRVISSATGRSVETRSRRMLRRDFLRIVGSTRVTVRTGDLSVELEEHHLEALRDFASRMDPAANASALEQLTAVVSSSGFDVRKRWYEPGEVDERAYPTTAPIIPTWYSSTPGQRREVRAEYVIDSTGRVDSASFRGMDEARDAPFLDAIRPLLREWEFAPARRHGRPVAQIVRQLFVFVAKPPRRPAPR